MLNNDSIRSQKVMVSLASVLKLAKDYNTLKALRDSGRSRTQESWPVMHDLFECQDCLAIETLNTHGRCARCNSNSVMSYDIIAKTCVEENAHTKGGHECASTNY